MFCNLKELFLNSGFTFAILQASGKLPKAMERLHNSLIGFAKIRAPSFKSFPEIWSIHAAFVTLIFFNMLNRQPSVAESNLKFSYNKRFSQ